MNELPKEILSRVRNLFGVLSVLLLASIVSIGVIVQSAVIGVALRVGLSIFFAFIILVSLAVLLFLLVRRPDLLFVKEISDLSRDQGRLDKVAFELSGRLTTSEETLLTVIRGRNDRSINRVESGRLIIGSKEYTEQRILGNILRHYVKSQLKEIKCERRIPNGGTLKNYADLANGWIDGYVEYTGTGCLFHKLDPKGMSLNKIIHELDKLSQKRHGIAWLRPLGNRNSYKIVMLSNKAKELGNIRTIKDLGTVANNLTLCGGTEFMTREDAFKGLERKYNLSFRNARIVAYGEEYEMLKTGLADVAGGLETDPEISEEYVKVLDDSLGFFPEYYAVPVFRVEALERIANLKEVLSQLENQLSTETMKDMLVEHTIRGTDDAITSDIAKKLVDDVNRRIERRTYNSNQGESVS